MANLLKPSDVAERLGISTSTLRVMVRRGSAPPHLRVGSHLRFSDEGVSDWIKAREIAASVAGSTLT